MAAGMLREGVRILVIDDDPALLGVIDRMLSRIGAEVTTVKTGADGLTAIERRPFDLLILDLMLPDIDGFEILESLRRNPRYDDMPILILSAIVNPDMISRGLMIGADAYLTKPYIPNTLNERVRTLLAQGRRPSSSQPISTI